MLSSDEQEPVSGEGGIFHLPDEDGPQPGWLLIVSSEFVGLRVDAFVSMRVPRLSRSRAGRLKLFEYPTHKPLKKSSIVSKGQQILAIRPVPDSAYAVTFEPEIIWENDRWCLVNKPPMIATHPSASYFKRTVSYWLSKQGRQRMQSVHRLDVETSGLLLFGKTADAVREGSDCFAQNQVKKSYLAVLSTVPAQDEWTIDVPLGLDPQSKIPVKMGPGSLSASTTFSILAKGMRVAVALVRPTGGRQHQIRVHAALSGCPLIGDKLYGPSEQYFLDRNKPLDKRGLNILGHWRHGLHAFRLEASFLPDVFEIPLPDDWLDIDDVIRWSHIKP